MLDLVVTILVLIVVNIMVLFIFFHEMIKRIDDIETTVKLVRRDQLEKQLLLPENSSASRMIRYRVLGKEIYQKDVLH